MKILFVAPIHKTSKYGDCIRIMEIVKRGSKEHEVLLLTAGLSNVAKAILNNSTKSVKLLQISKLFFKIPFFGLIPFGKIIKKYKPDIIQAEIHNTAYLCGILGKLMDIPVIFDIHGDPLAELKFYKTSFYVFKLFFCPLEYKIALSLATRILVVSEKQKLHLIKHHKINQGKIFLIPNGFTPENLEKPKKPVEKNKGVVTLCFVGSLAKWAGGDMLIKSFKQVLERCHKKLLLYIVGDGHDRKKLENLVKRYSLSENVIFTGNVPYDRVKEYLYSSNVLVAPFIKEPALEVACPIKLLEYSYVGKPIVTTNVGEIPGQLKIKNAAIVTEPDVNSFAQGILKIVASEELSEVIGKNAMVFSKEYTWDKICEKLSEIYNSVKYSVAL